MNTVTTLAIFACYCISVCLSRRYSANPNSTPTLLPPSDSQCFPLPSTDLTCAERNKVYGENAMPGKVIPKCDSYGNYESLQCFGSIGACCCVDQNGKQLEGPGNFRDPSNNGIKLNCE